MSLRARLRHLLRPRWPLPTWHHAAYRLPMASLLARTGLDPRRSDLAVWHLLKSDTITPEMVRPAPQIDYATLAMAHDRSWLDKLTRSTALASVFSVDPQDVPVDAVMETLRRVCGGTLEAARFALKRRRNVLNSAGGMHHATPTSGAGFCPVNDVAVAIAALRADGFNG